MNESINDRFAALAQADRRLLVAIVGSSLAVLVIGTVAGLMTALARGGMLTFLPETGYRFLTVHGTSIFFYWLYLAQTGLLAGFVAIENGQGLVWRGLTRIGFLSIILGFGLSMAGSVIGTPLLYDGAPSLAAEEPVTLLVFNLGYLLLGFGLMALPAAAIATLLAPRFQGRQAKFSAIGFALFVWAGFLMVSGFAALHAFVPGTLWALGMAEFPTSQQTSWHILFHNMHYLPLMATVLMWYVLMQALTGVTSIFGARFSKIVFALYLVFVPPTSLYHMFLEPDLPETVRVAGSLLSLFVSVPTLTAFLIIVTSLEVHARAKGGRGLFGWITMLPWHHPSMTAIGLAVVNMGLGMAFAFVLIQEKLAPLLSDTFFVPGYFHFFTVGTISLTLLAALAVVIPAMTGREMARPGLMRWMPWLASFGLLIFGGAGVTAGYLGVPRRVMDVSYSGEAPTMWGSLMATVAVGGSVMAAALLVFALGVAASLLPGRGTGLRLAVEDWSGESLKPGTTAWVGPLSVVLIVAAMYLFTVIGFEAMKALPLTAIGGTGH